MPAEPVDSPRERPLVSAVKIRQPFGKLSNHLLLLSNPIKHIIEIGSRGSSGLSRSCAKLCHSAGGELDQIQFLLGHVSVQTTERYLGCKQRIRGAVNDHMGIEP